MNDNLNIAKFWRSPEFNGLELVRAQYTTRSFPKHMHQTYVLGVILDGVEKFYCRGKLHSAPAGSVIVVNPGDVHTGFSAGDRPWIYRCMYPTVALMTSLQRDLSGESCNTPFFSSNVIHDNRLYVKLKSFHQGLERNQTNLNVHELFLDCISYLLLRHTYNKNEFNEPGTEPRAIKNAKSYIHENFPKKIFIDELSDVSNLSRYYFIRAFKKHTGITPHKYLVNIRIQHARKLLSDGHEIAEVAYKTGFSDQSHLTRLFKRIVGVTPGTFTE